MCQVISIDSIKKANERSIKRNTSKISMDERTAQIMCHTIFETQTITVPRDMIYKVGRGLN